MRTTGSTLIWLLSLGVAGYAVYTYAFFPVGVYVHPDIRATLQANAAIVLTHAFSSALALAAGPLQFWNRLRSAAPAAHRWIGRLYFYAGVLLGAISGLYLALHAYGGPVSRVGFGALAIAWLYTGLRALLAIRAGDVPGHRRWMIRNYALAFAAVTLRLYIPAALASGVEFATAYPLIAWLCWVPNLLIASRIRGYN